MEEDGYELFHTAHMSVTERLIACLKNETMTDVALVGDDGIPVPACRYVLGSASAAFQPLLYGNFRTESNSSTVNIRESNQKCLTAMVEFCCSDELNTSIWADSSPPVIVQDTVALAKLAHTYDLPLLQFAVRDFLNPLMITYPPLACLVFNLADEVLTPDVYAAAQVILQEKPYVALKGRSNATAIVPPVGGITCLSPNKLETLLSDNEVEADELFLFKQLVVWRDYNESKYTNINEICKSMVHHLDISTIDPNAIETIVMQSGFVTAEMLVKALMAQAKSATSEGLAFASIRGPRGRKYAHVLVQGAGVADCNGVYVHVKRDKLMKSPPGSGTSTPTSQGRNLVYFIKKPKSGKFPNVHPHDHSSSMKIPKSYILVEDKYGIWRICDSEKNILYQWDPDDGDTTDTTKSSINFPHKGWTCVVGDLPPPECSWNRDPHKGSSVTTAPSSADSSICSPPRLANESREVFDVSSPPRPPAAASGNERFDTSWSATRQNTENRERPVASLDVSSSPPDHSAPKGHVGTVPTKQSMENRERTVRSKDVPSSPPDHSAPKGHVETVPTKQSMENREWTVRSKDVSSSPPDHSAPKGYLEMDIVPEEKKESTEETKVALNQLKENQKEKRKISRTSALVDGENSILDPIVGTTIGGTGFRVSAERKSKDGETANLSTLRFKNRVRGVDVPNSKAPKPFSGIVDRYQPPPSSYKTEGEGVLVGCASAAMSAPCK